MLPGALLVLVFIGLSGLHWYWVVGGAGELTGFVPEIDGKAAARRQLPLCSDDN